MNRRILLTLLLSLALAACGPIYGQMMLADNGIKDFSVRKGRLSDLRRGESILVYGPFAKTGDAFYICRGEDAAHFATEMQKAGFKTELYIEHTFKNLQQTASALRGMTPEQLRSELQLDILPDKILFGTILTRHFSVAPARGVEARQSFRLEFFDLKGRDPLVVEIASEEMVQDSIPGMVAELRRRL